MDVYQIITERIIEKLESGTVPWHKPWRSISAPQNLVSKKHYRGINVWLLTMQGYASPYWATLRQINQLGGQVRKGEKSMPVVFWRIYVDGIEVKPGEAEPEAQEAEGQGRRRFVLRYFRFSIPNNANCRHRSPRSWRFPNLGNSIPSKRVRGFLPACPIRPRLCTRAIRLSIHR
jgi:antirestriction protein ArdC